ncbi:MAG: hypothetical protein RSA10_03140 [Bacilli bacterium]
MKNMLTFIPLGISISSAIIYLGNIIFYKLANNAIMLNQIILNLKIYLYISIISLVIYFLIKILIELKDKNISKTANFVPKALVKQKKLSLFQNSEFEFRKCDNCNAKILVDDNYCSVCGRYQESKKQIKNKLKTLINLLEIVILILMLYFLTALLFEYKESVDHNFKSPLKVEKTK